MGIFKKISSILIVELLVQQYLDMPYSKDTWNIIISTIQDSMFREVGKKS